MSRQAPSSHKRKQPDSSSLMDTLTEHERIIYNIIKSRQDMGIVAGDLKNEAKLPQNIVNKSLKSLLAKMLIKDVVNIQNKGRKCYIAAEFEPSKEITGGDWYSEGNLDTEFIKFVKDQCLKHIKKFNIATLEAIMDSIKKSGIFKVELKKQQIEEILKALVLENAVMELKSNGLGEFTNIPVGKVCYKVISQGGGGGEPKIGVLALIPCGVCPQISVCTPDGLISPKTCVYYNKWLDF